MNTKQRIIEDSNTPFSSIYKDDNKAHGILEKLLIDGNAPYARANEVALGAVDIVGRMLSAMESAYINNTGAKAFIEVCKINDEVVSFIAHSSHLLQKYPVALATVNTVREMSLFQSVFFMSESEKAISDQSHGVNTVSSQSTSIH